MRDTGKQARPRAALLAEITNVNVPKNEREWAAQEHIAHQAAEIARLRAHIQQAADGEHDRMMRYTEDVRRGVETCSAVASKFRRDWHLAALAPQGEDHG